MEMDEKAKELMKKCEEKADEPELIGTCKVLLETLEEKKVKIPEEPADMTYIQMAESISPEDVPLVLKMALRIAKSGDIKDDEVKDAAERLIRYLG